MPMRVPMRLDPSIHFIQDLLVSHSVLSSVYPSSSLWWLSFRTLYDLVSAL